MKTTKSFKILMAVAVFAVTLGGCAGVPKAPEHVGRGDYAAVTAHLEALIGHEMRSQDVTGLSIAIVEDQRIVWARGFGWADREAGVPATPATVYRMGSISKLFTATAAMQLAGAGRLDIDAPIQQALPGFAIRSRYPAAAITPRLLMTHHAGLPRDVLRGMWGREVGDFRAITATLGDTDLAYPPGAVLAYSNLGFSVLGAAVAQRAGQPFADHLRTSLLEPLGMHGASFSSAPPPATRAYDKGKPADEPALRDLPAGGLNANVLDMSRFLAMVFADGRANRRAVLEPAALAEMLRVQNGGVALDGDMRIGLAWMLASFGSDTLRGAGTVAHHNGATINHRAQLYALPEHKLGVIVASNSATAGPVVDLIAKRALALALEARSGIRQSDAGPDFQPVEAPWPEAALQSWPGDYATLAGHVRVVREDTRLTAQIAGRTLQLRPGEGGSAGLRFALFGLLRIPLGELERVALRRETLAGRQVLVATVGGQHLAVGERLDRGDDVRFDRLAGEYEPVAGAGEFVPIESVEVKRDGAVLLARLRLRIGDAPPMFVPLKPVSETEILALGTLADAGEVIRLHQVDGETRFSFSGYEFRRKAR